LGFGPLPRWGSPRLADECPGAAVLADGHHVPSPGLSYFGLSALRNGGRPVSRSMGKPCLIQPAVYLEGMKAVTISISLNPDLAEFARADSEARAYDSMSEYMQDLIRNRRQAQIEADVAFLEKAIAGAPLGYPSDKEVADIYATIKARRKIQ
jgi:Arc/MetJ-type ribon-helix-helix transcriptional regulator